MKLTKGLVIPDLQCRRARNGDPSGEDTESLLALRRYVDKNGPYDWGVQLGDWLDLPYFSRFDTTTRLDDAVKYYQEDVAHGVKVLRPFVEACKEFTIIEGNHDYRFKAYLQRYPHLEELIDSPRMAAYLNLRACWSPYWSNKNLSVQYGKAEFIHGRYANKYHAEKHAREYLGSNVFYGHVHDWQGYAPVVRNVGHVPFAMSLGCLCRLYQPWANGASNNWINLFAEFFMRENGNFTFFPTAVYDAEFTGRDGKVYKGGKK